MGLLTCQEITNYQKETILDIFTADLIVVIRSDQNKVETGNYHKNHPENRQSLL